MSLLEAASNTLAPYADMVGSSYAEKLVNARNEALARLQTHVPDLDYQTPIAVAAMDEIQAWADRNASELEAALLAGEAAIAEELRLHLGADKAASYVIATYSRAASGMGPWSSGLVEDIVYGRVESDDQFTLAWAQQDAEDRLNVFAGIIEMDKKGELSNIFNAAKSGASGFGEPLTGGVILLIIGLAAVCTAGIIIGIMRARAISDANIRLEAQCKAAADRGDTKASLACINANKEIINDATGILPSGSWVGSLLKMPASSLLLWAGAIFVAIKFGIPWLQSRAHDSRMRREMDLAEGPVRP